MKPEFPGTIRGLDYNVACKKADGAKIRYLRLEEVVDMYVVSSNEMRPTHSDGGFGDVW